MGTTVSGARVTGTTERDDAGTTERNHDRVGRRRPDDRIVASLALGVAGLFFFNVVFGPLAVALGLWALRRPAVAGRGRFFAGLGVVLGLADVVVLAVLLMANAHGGSLLQVPAG